MPTARWTGSTNTSRRHGTDQLPPVPLLGRGQDCGNLSKVDSQSGPQRQESRAFEDDVASRFEKNRRSRRFSRQDRSAHAISVGSPWNVSMTAASHPTSAELQAFALGTLPDAIAVDVESHLADCTECEHAAAVAPDDTLVTLLRLPGCSGPSRRASGWPPPGRRSSPTPGRRGRGSVGWPPST